LIWWTYRYQALDRFDKRLQKLYVWRELVKATGPVGPKTALSLT
jgi:hypothetical protein